MFEKFSDRSRKTMQLANQEAQRFNHEYIGTEHILLGLLKEGTGTAAMALKNLDVDLRKIRLEVEKLVQSGPELVTMGKLPHTPGAKAVIELAMDESRQLKHNHVGTEHILIGMLRQKDGVAAQVLNNLGVTTDVARKAVLDLTLRPVEGTENKTTAFLLTVSIWTTEARKSAVESARCVVTALAPSARDTQARWVDGEREAYGSALKLLTEQISETNDADK